MIQEAELRSRIADALNGDSSLEDLRRWLDANSWNMHKDSSPAAVDLASAVQLLFYEFDDGAHSIADLRSELGALNARILEQFPR